MATPIGAKLVGGGLAVPKGQHRKIDFTQVEWDSGNFFRPSQPNRLRIPSARGGRYLVQLAIRWTWLDSSSPPADPTSSYFYAAVLVNNQNHGNDARSTVARAPHASSTTQLIVHETDLAGGDRLQASVWHGFDDLVFVDVYFQARRLGDSA